MITKNNIINGSICGLICVAFMWIYMSFAGHGKMSMDMHGSVMDMGDMTMNDMVKMMQGKTGKDIEKEFLTGMIPHHKGAVDMANLLLKDKTISPEIKNFAENIIKTQEGEINMMNLWLEKYK